MRWRQVTRFIVVVGLVWATLAACSQGTAASPTAVAAATATRPPRPQRPPRPSAVAPRPSPSPAPSATAAPTDATAAETAAPFPPVPPLGQDLARGTRDAYTDGPVHMVQAWLTALGYTEVGPVDGIFGPKTEAAVRHFQQDQALPTTGVVDAVTWQALYGAYMQQAAAATATVASMLAAQRPLQMGDTGEDVAQLNQDLLRYGFIQCPSSGFALDTFGPVTETAVRLAQRASGLTPDGVVTPEQWHAWRTRGWPSPATAWQQDFPVRAVGAVHGAGDDVTYGQGALWTAADTVVRKLDPDSGALIREIPVPEWADLTYRHPDTGEDLPFVTHARAVAPTAATLWVGGSGMFRSAPVPAAPWFRPFTLQGQAQGDPFLLVNGPQDLLDMAYTPGSVVAIVPDDTGLWVLWQPYTFPLSAARYSSAGVLEQSYELAWMLEDTRVNEFDATDAVQAHDTLWVALQGAVGGSNSWYPLPVAGVTAEGRSAGTLGVCGTALAYDGRWLWVARATDDGAVMVGVNPTSGEVEAQMTFDEPVHGLASDGLGRVWVITRPGEGAYRLWVVTTGSSES